MRVTRGKRSLAGPGALAAAVLLASSPADAGSHSCLGTAKPLIIVDETAVVVGNPEAVENQLRTALCVPLTDRPGVLHDYDGVEVGLFNYLGPVYDYQGAYVALAPLSILQLRVGAAGVGLWPLPLDGAGYFALPGYTPRFRDVDLPRAAARSAFGLNVNLSASLQGAVSLTGPISLIVNDLFSGDFWSLGSAGYYFNPRQDVVLARSDWVVKNYATLLLEIRASAQLNVHVGLVDDFTLVPASGYRANILALFISVPIRRENGAPRDLEPFVRFGGYTNHAYRSGFQLLAGISVAWGKPTGFGAATEAQ